MLPNMQVRIFHVGKVIYGAVVRGREIVWATKSMHPSDELTASYAAQDWLEQNRRWYK